MVEESAKGDTSVAHRGSEIQKTPQKITEVSTAGSDRLSTQIPEFDRVLGGGIVAGSLILLGGQPGIGKSTILLQVGFNIAQEGNTVLIVSGEESPHQLRMRANRLDAAHDNLLILAETDIEQIHAAVEQLSPSLLVLDSIQTVFHPEMSAPPGSVSQLRECTNFICQFAKTKNIPVFIIGHVTKEGSIAGPRVLEHMVDSVLYFETSSNQSSRIIRSVKNRFGSTNEIAVFEMKETGLAQVDNPSALFLAQHSESLSGSVVVALAEGSRSLLVELQALVVPSYLANPRRFTSGMDYNRLSVLIAVLEKRGGLRLENKDVYLNAVGGVKISEPAADLGAALAIASSCQDTKIDQDLVAIGEIGLGGEVRPISSMEGRIKEAAKLGFNKVILPHSEKGPPGADQECTIVSVKTINDALDFLG